MHVLYLHQHFALPSGSTGTRSYEMARRWVAAGHRVTMICGRGDICGLPPLRAFKADGIQVYVAGAAYSQKQGVCRRMWAFLCFMAACTLKGIRVPSVDVIFATSTPLTIGIPAMLLKQLKRIPFIFEVRDQWPQVPIEMGYIKNSVAKRLLLWLERRIYKSAAAIVALSPGMADGIRHVLGRTSKAICIVPNCADTELFRSDIDGSPIRLQNGWHNKFIIMHFGTVGHANGLDFLVQAAAELKDNADILFVLIGSGREKTRLQEEAAKRDLANIVFCDNVSKSQLPQWVAACDISTVIFADYPILEHNSANKFFDSLSAGKPILLNYSGWQRELIESHECGYGCKRHDLQEYVNRINSLFGRKEQLKRMGQNARRLAENEFDRQMLSDKLLAVLTSSLKAVNS